MIPPEAVNVEDIADTALPESTVSSARTTGTERICKPKEQRAQVEKRGRGATEAATENRAAAEAWDALPTPAATQADQCRHGAALAERTRRRWAR